RRSALAQITTLHGRLDIPELPSLYRAYPEMPVVSISFGQRKPLAWLNWQGNVYHGMPPELFTFRNHEPPPSDDYLAFLGRTSPEKGLDSAIEIAQRSGHKLKIAAKVDNADKQYFEEKIEPLLRHDGVEFMGEIGGAEKDRFLGGARALLFPISWPEPFGLVFIEAMACGTPIIAFPSGSVPEVMQEGVTGVTVANVDEAVRAVGQLDALDRGQCRAAFEARFTARRMAQDYVAIYERLVSRRRSSPSHTFPLEPLR